MPSSSDNLFHATRRLVLSFPGIPPPRRTAQQKGVFVRNNRPFFYTRAPQRREQQNWVALISAKLPPDFSIITGPVRVEARMIYLYRKGERRANVLAGRAVPHDVRPDLDNILKGLLDAMVGAGVFLDDAQIAELEAAKYWGEKQGVSIVISELT